MSRLETIRDIMSIIRDALLIIVLLIMIFGIFIILSFMMNLSSAIQSGGLGGMLPMLGGLIAGNIGSPASSSAYGNLGDTSSYAKVEHGKYQLDTKLKQIFEDIGNAFQEGNYSEAMSLLDKLIAEFDDRGMTDASETAKKLKSSLLSGNFNAVETYAKQLAILFGYKID